MDENNTVLAAVQNINDDLENDNEYLYLEYVCGSYSEAVTVGGGICIWSSQGDGMPHDESGQELPFEPYLRGLFMRFLESCSETLKKMTSLQLGLTSGI